MKAVVADALQKYGRLDVFFANAGVVGQPVSFTDMSAEGFAKTMNTNTIRFVLHQLLFAFSQNLSSKDFSPGLPPRKEEQEEKEVIIN